MINRYLNLTSVGKQYNEWFLADFLGREEKRKKGKISNNGEKERKLVISLVKNFREES